MPTFKNRTKRTRRKRRTPKKNNTKNLERRLTRLEHTQELKYSDDHPNASPDPSGTIIALSNLAQGDDWNQRIGEQVTAKYLNLNLKITHTAAAGADIIRMMVIWDKQNNGATSINLFTSTGKSTALLDDDSVSFPSGMPRNYRTKERFVFLMDKILTINPDSTGTNKIFNIRRNFKLGNARVKYSDSGNTDASLPSRALLFIFFSDSAVATTNLNGNIRFWYTDA